MLTPKGAIEISNMLIRHDFENSPGGIPVTCLVICAGLPTEDDKSWKIVRTFCRLLGFTSYYKMNKSCECICKPDAEAIALGEFQEVNYVD